MSTGYDASSSGGEKPQGGSRDSCGTYRKISAITNAVQDALNAGLRLVEEIEGQDHVSPRITRKAELLKEKIKAVDSI